LRINAVPAPQVGEQAQGDRDSRLPLVGLRAALLPPIVTSMLEIDKRAADRQNRRCGCDRSRARPAVDPEQDEASKMSKRPLRCRSLHIVRRPTRSLLHFTITPASPDQFGCITASQPFVARLTSFWQRDSNDFAMIALGGMMADSRAQVFQV